MEKVFRFVFFVRNSEYPNDAIRFVVRVVGFENSRRLFSHNGNYIFDCELRPYLSPRQYARLTSFYNKPRHHDLFCLWIDSYKALN